VPDGCDGALAGEPRLMSGSIHGFDGAAELAHCSF
jgi:hypothetical protein